MKERNKKGFTLIELLAVIVILAIIALIATPIVMNLISKARKSAAEDSAYGMVKAAENYYAGTLLETSGNGISSDLIFSCTKDGCKIDKDKELTFNGTKPSSGTITIKPDGKVQIKDLVINNYICNYKENSTGIECLSIGQTPTTTKPTVIGQNFSTDSWEIIIEAVNENSYAYQVGDTKTIDMGTTLGTHTVRIANTTPCDGSLDSETACGFVIEFADIITTHVMKDTATNVGGWPATKMRTYLNSETDPNSIYNALPATLRSGIINTKVISGHGSTSGETNFESTDKLYLLSNAELRANGVSGDSTSDSTITRQLDYYALETSTRIKQSNGSNAYWWLRSANSYNTSSFYTVNSDGYGIILSANCTGVGVSPAFRLK